MRVICIECGNKGSIKHREQTSPSFAKLYCLCTDPHCGHTWVDHLTYSHTLSPSAKAYDKSLFDRLCEMPKARQKELFDLLNRQQVA